MLTDTKVQNYTRKRLVSTIWTQASLTNLNTLIGINALKIIFAFCNVYHGP